MISAESQNLDMTVRMVNNMPLWQSKGNSSIGSE